ncbi:acetyl-CoA carboxylase biotin carboxyl carrier protein subunit [Salipaludibacillus neizhouensis]|uniref:Acetyl-CoA carboxylase biotin carboxyl carrier protein subunit n=1 Tax=Salipaludibacillus neizhouensis TaxID=885475 RepID=A0A3A9KAA9_9BACI|nr:acetyl-CoA carboxylase biotin carboxyl carrier protein subunit [Salipaludibacillus neizhouensis]RKL68508.1 acetyl-CoA carboxylase biotin carboxyl carrier protein subunit [Salipaludibacillus neizhouensis]
MKAIKSNMAGSVWKILVSVGDEVNIGQEVIILESMKMEIPIVSEEKGVVDDIVVNEGAFVDEDVVLVRLKG